MMMELNNLRLFRDMFSININLTRATTSSCKGLEIQLERPDLSEFMQPGGDTNASKTLVFACGPEGMIDQAHALANQFGYHFHAETFVL